MFYFNRPSIFSKCCQDLIQILRDEIKISILYTLCISNLLNKREIMCYESALRIRITTGVFLGNGYKIVCPEREMFVNNYVYNGNIR